MIRTTKKFVSVFSLPERREIPLTVDIKIRSHAVPSAVDPVPDAQHAIGIAVAAVQLEAVKHIIDFIHPLQEAEINDGAIPAN